MSLQYITLDEVINAARKYHSERLLGYQISTNEKPQYSYPYPNHCRCPLGAALDPGVLETIMDRELNTKKMGDLIEARIISCDPSERGQIFEILEAHDVIFTRRTPRTKRLDELKFLQLIGVDPHA